MANPTQGAGLQVYSPVGKDKVYPSPIKYTVPATVTVPVQNGDPMVMVAGGTLTPYTVADDGVFGVVCEVYDSEGKELPDPNASTHTMANTGSTARQVTVYRGTDITYQIREDSDASDIVAADIGQNAELIGLASNAGHNPPFTSGWMLDSSSHATTATLPVRITDIKSADLENPDATDSDSNKIILVQIQNEQAAI